MLTLKSSETISFVPSVSRLADRWVDMNLRRCRLAGLAILLTLAIPTTAQAEGGKSIASAPTVPYGQQQFGNMVNGAVEDRNSSFFCDEKNYRSWWLLPVAVGDRVTIDWGVADENVHLFVLPVGATDYNRGDMESLVDDVPGDNLKSEARFTATEPGAMPLEFAQCTGTPGPYDFVAYVEHALRLLLPRTPLLATGGKIVVGVSTPDGAPIDDPSVLVTLQAKKRSKTRYKTIGTGNVSKGAATVSYKLPKRLRRTKLNLRAIAEGANYVKETSASQKVRSK